MKIAIAQISSVLGDLRNNFELHLEYIQQAKKEKTDLIVFPELSLTGYTLKDLVENVAINPSNNHYINELKLLSRDISIVFGFVEEKERGIFYNSAAFLSKGEISHIHRKVFLPTYGMFEEGKFFAQGKYFKTFPTPFAKAGMMICYDFLNYGASYVLFAGGAELIIVISAAPGRGNGKDGRFASQRMWELMGEAISYFSTTFLIYCNRVGTEDGKIFAGGSFLFNPEGKLLAKAKDIHTDFLIQDIDLHDINRTRKKRCYKRDDKPEIILHALNRAIKSYED